MKPCLLAVLLILSGCATMDPDAPTKICAMQGVGQSGQGYLIVRMKCKPEGESV